MNVSDEKRVLAAVKRFEELEKRIAAMEEKYDKDVVEEKQPDLTPIEIKRIKQKEAFEEKVKQNKINADKEIERLEKEQEGSDEE